MDYKKMEEFKAAKAAFEGAYTKGPYARELEWQFNDAWINCEEHVSQYVAERLDAHMMASTAIGW